MSSWRHCFRLGGQEDLFGGATFKLFVKCQEASRVKVWKQNLPCQGKAKALRLE